MKIKGVFKEVSYITFSSFFGQLISLFLVFYVAKDLGPDKFGQFSYLISVIILFPIISGFGVPNAIFRFYNTVDDIKQKEQVLSTGFFFVVFTSLLLSVIIYLILSLVDYEMISSFRFLSCCYGFLISITAILNTILRAKRDYKKTSFVNLIHPLIKSFIIICIILFFNLSVSSLLIASILSELFIASYLIFNIDEKIGLRYFSVLRLKMLLKYGVSFVPHRFVSKSQDPIIKSFILSIFGTDYVGLYSLAQKMTLPFSFVIEKIQFIWGPLKFDIKKNIKNPKYYFQKVAESYISLNSLIAVIYIFVILLIKSFNLFDLYEGAEYLTLVLIIITFLRSNYYMYATGAEFGDNMYMLPFSSIGYLCIVFVCYTYFLFFHTNIFYLMIPIIIAELYSIVLLRIYSMTIYFFKINYFTYFITLSFALFTIIFTINKNSTYFILFFIVSIVSIFINRNSIKITKDMMSNKL